MRARGGRPPGAGRFSAKAARQIAALQALKRSATPAERKLGSRLAVTLRRRSSRAIRRALPRLATGVAVSSAGRTDVDVRATAVTADLVGRLRRAGATVHSTSARADSLRVTIPLGALKAVAGWHDVRRITVAAEAMTHGEPRAAARRESKAAKAARLERALARRPLRRGRSSPRATRRTPRTPHAPRRA